MQTKNNKSRTTYNVLFFITIKKIRNCLLHTYSIRCAQVTSVKLKTLILSIIPFLHYPCIRWWWLRSWCPWNGSTPRTLWNLKWGPANIFNPLTKRINIKIHQQFYVWYMYLFCSLPYQSRSLPNNFS